MNRDSRLSAVLHALLHMAEHQGPMTSEALAACMQTNPAVVRRTMAGLREMGLVASEKGHGGGWRMARPLEAITLRDIHEALGTPRLFAIGHKSENPSCLVEQAVNAALGETLREAEALLVQRFGGITLAALSADFHRRLAARGAACGGSHHAA
ncbi:Rrf2 family transcriptional regulator [Pseudoroseomonas cervicalis]|uniref:Rrf2 family transcriptional regulator n=1 Tax=Teichococcus cervicalis TaxID=204525 RepID=UPI0022F15343|nr:Rrf2 family transcriptional regulator [Pseudoroseomonas cervicalis]WBV41406.1 Rrf2 family transcriptional regulator [Pseudoroseomonas cervicalis]